MLNEFGTSFSALPLLDHVRDLESFEGPILSELRAPNNALYLEKWCAYHEDSVRTLVVRSDQRSVAEYLACRTTMLDLLTKPNDDVGFLVDRIGDETGQVRLVQVTSLPQKYLPKPAARHDESLRPDWAMTPQTFLVDADWDVTLLSDLERRYKNVYAFNFFTDVNSDKEPPLSLLSYVLEGYGYGRLCRALRVSVPKNDNAKAIGVAAASPGVLTIAAPTEVAERVATTMSYAARDGAVKAYGILHEWSKFKEKKAGDVPPTAAADIRRLCEALNMDVVKILPQVYSEDVDPAQLLRAGKVVAAYYRSLWKLIDPKLSGVEFLAPAVVREGSATSSSIDEDEESDEEDDDYDYDEETW